ncbi:elongation factor G [Lactobacillus farciminis KCTC 3681 = DSM] [Lactiplantibacillus mudanjiangensis]|nr:elongation factor G [Lactobacillus farciminis KCTC 3681 = DSM] [Lactiplantibacillus mudanjiangensis]
MYKRQGPVDFAAQTEQVLSVLDYAILVVSATDGVQGYTRTLWRLLAHYCLLYTSDAADEEDRVDLGGRRIIKKKKKKKIEKKQNATER